MSIPKPEIDLRNVTPTVLLSRLYSGLDRLGPSDRIRIRCAIAAEHVASLIERDRPALFEYRAVGTDSPDIVLEVRRRQRQPIFEGNGAVG
jgi:hypothetical protein